MKLRAIDYYVHYAKVNRIARQTDRSDMDPKTHREFMTILDRAQQIINLEAQQAGYADLSER